jgi:hypothetical protein
MTSSACRSMRLPVPAETPPDIPPVPSCTCRTCLRCPLPPANRIHQLPAAGPG